MEVLLWLDFRLDGSNRLRTSRVGTEALFFGQLLRGGLFCTSSLVAKVSAHKVIPPAETCRVATKEGHVVVVVVVGTCPDREPVVHTEGEVIA